MNDEQILNEKINVICVFDDSLHLCRPIRFRRANKREVQVVEIGLRHPTAKGERTVHVFDVTDGQSDYRLEFDSYRLSWYLTRESEHEM